WSGSLGNASIDLVQRELDRLAGVGGRWRDTHQRRDLVSRRLRIGELHPLSHPSIELVRRNILRGDKASLLPVAGQGMRQRQVLANRRVSTLLTSCWIEHCDRLIRAASQRHRQTVI